MAALEIKPLDRRSVKGREVADRLTDILADIRLAVAERERDALRPVSTERGAA